MRFLGKIFKKKEPVSGVSEAFTKNQSAIEKTLGYSFLKPHLLERALTHSSFASQNNMSYSYERLEFLGDAVLQLVVSDYLFKTHLHLNEGTLTKYRTILVNGSYLAECATRLDLGRWILLSDSSRRGGQRDNDSIMADVIESLIAAIYLDGGYEPAARWVKQHVIAGKPDYPEELQTFNFKGQLAEKCQRLKMGNPVFEVTKTTGPDHDPLYLIQVSIDATVVGFGEGRNKKEASQHASEDSLKNWDIHFPG
ncbi:ribonuclease III [bacterium]|nr:ribonuclease III [bacterium]